ncbi:MAG: DUF3011 domain-containing protein [Thermodesulforhabdaceae bacterium]
MMFLQKHLIWLVSLVALGVLYPVLSEAKVVVCESHKMRYRFCEVEVRGSVRMIKQISDAPCIEGQTWGYDRYGIWVTNGCRAKFEIEERVSGPKVIKISCESEHERYQYCPVSVVVGEVRLLKQFSKSPCIEGQSWGFDKHGVWVDSGCRGEFAIYPEVRYYPGRHRIEPDNREPQVIPYSPNVPVQKRKW